MSHAILSQKLKALKMELRSWNKLVFGNIHSRVKSALEMVDQVQQQIDLTGPSDSLLEQEVGAQIELHHALACEEDFWREKSWLNCHCSGDQNINFFHQVTKIRCAAKSMTMLKEGDVIIEEQETMEQHVLNFFSSLYASSNECEPNDLIKKVVPSLVNTTDNDSLTCLPSHEQIKQVVFSMNGDGAPGPDGFGGCFYNSFWDIIGQDVCNLVSQFFTNRIEDFRPIALANFQFKIITKVLADRLALIATKIVSS